MLRRLLFCLLAALPLTAQEPATLSIDGRTLWTITTPRAGFSAAERAEDIRSSIIHVAEDNRRGLDDIREVDSADESVLLISRIYVFSVTDEDARLAGRTRPALFAERKQLVLDSIARYRSDRALPNRLRSFALAAGALLLALVSLILLRKAHRAIAQRLHASIALQSRTGRLAALYRLFEAPLLFLLRLTLRLAFVTLALSILFGLSSFALGLFPATMGISAAVAAQAWSLVAGLGQNIIAYLPNLLVLFVVAAMVYAFIWVARQLSRAIASGGLVIEGFHREWAAPTYDLVKFLLILFGLVVAFPYLPGGESPALKGASIFVGVLVSLGSGSAMGNIVAGVILTYMRPFRVGDRVQIADSTGDVIERSLLVTRIRTIKNVEVILPNSAVLGGHILNYSAHAEAQGLILHSTVTLGYDAPWRQVHELLIRAALRTTCILPEPRPFVLQTSLNDSHISYEVNAYTTAANRMAELYSELHKNIQEEFNTAGVEIMSPMYLSVRDGNTVTTPEADRPPGYEPPSFRIQERPR
jgi:small-conductance mechanosensitive channel